MGKSARVLGQEIGKTGREMNALLKEHGFLEGEPGDYSLTDKGKEYGHERYEHRGVGGSARYNPEWTIRTWDESVLDALAGERDAPAVAVSEENRAATSLTEFDDDIESEDSGNAAAWLGLGVVAVAVGVAVTPHAKRWWSGTVAPGTRRLWNAIAGSRSADAADEGDSTQAERAQ